MTRIPLLYVAPWVVPGGSDKGTVDWFRTIDRTRFELHLATTAVAADNTYLRSVEPWADAVWNLPDLVPEPAWAPFLLRYVGEAGIALVHVMNSHLGFDLVPAWRARYPGVPLVVQLHAEEDDASRYVRYVANRYGHLVDAFSATSEDLRRRIIGHGVDPERVEVIYTGIDAAEEWAPAERIATAGSGGPLQILYPGRLETQKDPDLMVDIAAALHRAGVAVEVHVVGDGALAAGLRARVAAEGLTEVVRFHGVSYEMQAWYERADVVVMTSRFEGIPYVLFESMAMGVPTVVPDVNANAEVVDDEVGVLIADRSDVASYVAALSGLAADPAARRALGTAARRRMLDRFPLTRMARDHEALYDRLLSGGHPRSAGGDN